MGGKQTVRATIRGVIVLLRDEGHDLGDRVNYVGKSRYVAAI